MAQLLLYVNGVETATLNNYVPLCSCVSTPEALNEFSEKDFSGLFPVTAKIGSARIYMIKMRLCARV
jgi:hypothetical protein